MNAVLSGLLESAAQEEPKLPRIDSLEDLASEEVLDKLVVAY